MRIKIYGQPAVQGGESLCETCRLAQIIRGRRVDEELVLCQATAIRLVRITFRVATCSDYVDDREPSYSELAEKAWILKPATRGRPAGFVRASDLKGEELSRYLMAPRERD